MHHASRVAQLPLARLVALRVERHEQPPPLQRRHALELAVDRAAPPVHLPRRRDPRRRRRDLFACFKGRDHAHLSRSSARAPSTFSIRERERKRESAFFERGRAKRPRETTRRLGRVQIKRTSSSRVLLPSSSSSSYGPQGASNPSTQFSSVHCSNCVQAFFCDRSSEKARVRSRVAIEQHAQPRPPTVCPTRRFLFCSALPMLPRMTPRPVFAKDSGFGSGGFARSSNSQALAGRRAASDSQSLFWGKGGLRGRGGTRQSPAGSHYEWRPGGGFWSVEPTLQQQKRQFDW